MVLLLLIAGSQKKQYVYSEPEGIFKCYKKTESLQGLVLGM